MSEIVSMREAKATLARLVERACAGEAIVIAKAGKPLVQLVPVTHCTKPRVPGKWRGKVWMANDFDQLQDDMRDAFEGRKT